LSATFFTLYLFLLKNSGFHSYTYQVSFALAFLLLRHLVLVTGGEKKKKEALLMNVTEES
jgi:hypothetical protein